MGMNFSFIRNIIKFLLFRNLQNTGIARKEIMKETEAVNNTSNIKQGFYVYKNRLKPYSLSFEYESFNIDTLSNDPMFTGTFDLKQIIINGWIF